MDYRTAVAVTKRRGPRVRLSDVLRLGTLAALGVCLLPAGTPPQQADELIQRVEVRYNDARTLQLDFVENFATQGHARPSEAGQLTLRKQGKMRWDYTRPAGKLLVSDGKMIYLYTAGDNRVERFPLKTTEDLRAPLAFLLGHLDLKKEFGSFQVRPEAVGTWLDASAKSDRTAYEKVEMLIDGEGAVRQLRVDGREGSSMQFAFANEKLNLPVEDNAFRFTIPPGAQVVDALEFGAERR